MSVAFWATKIVAGKPVEVQPPEGFVLNLQQAAIVNGKDNQSYTVNVETLAIEGDKLESVIGTLRPGKVDQFNFNLVFGYDVPTKFSITTGDKDGKAVVHLSGYFQPAPEEDGDDEEMDYDDFDEEDGEDEEDDEEESRVVELDANDKPKKNEVAKKVEAKAESKQPAAANKKPAAQPKKPVVEESDDDEDEDDEDEEAHIEKLKALLKKGGDDDEDSEEEEDSEDDDEDDEEDLPPLKVQKTAPQGFAPGSAKKNDNKSAPSSAQKTNNNNNQNKTPQANKNQGQNKGPQSANKPNNNNNQQNKTPQQHKNNNNNQNSNNKGNKFQSGDKRKR